MYYLVTNYQVYQVSGRIVKCIIIRCTSFPNILFLRHVRRHLPTLCVLLYLITSTVSGKVVSPAMTCFLGPARMEQIPRVWQYARRAQGRHGKRMVLPCRVVEHDVDMTTNWYFRGKQLGRGRNTNKYEVRTVRMR